MLFPIGFAVAFLFFVLAVLPQGGIAGWSLAPYAIGILIGALISLIVGFLVAMLVGRYVPKVWIAVREEALESIGGNNSLFLYRSWGRPWNGGKMEAFIDYNSGGSIVSLPEDVVEITEEHGRTDGMLKIERCQFAHWAWWLVAIGPLDDPPADHRHNFYIPVNGVARAIDELG